VILHHQESPAERFARRQREKDAARAPLTIEPAAPAPKKTKADAPVVRKRRIRRSAPRRVSLELAQRAADVVQREGLTEAAKVFGVHRETIRSWMRAHGLRECHPIVRAEEYARTHGLRTWRRTWVHDSPAILETARKLLPKSTASTCSTKRINAHGGDPFEQDHSFSEDDSA
jgi:hypothetical protein